MAMPPRAALLASSRLVATDDAGPPSVGRSALLRTSLRNRACDRVLPMFTLDQVVPWGRSFDEYCRMFDLTKDDLSRSIIGCGDGPASFNAEASRRGTHVISCDPLYRFEKPQIEERIAATFEQITEQTRRNAHEF